MNGLHIQISFTETISILGGRSVCLSGMNLIKKSPGFEIRQISRTNCGLEWMFKVVLMKIKLIAIRFHSRTNLIDQK